MSDEITIRLTDDGPVRIRGNGDVWERGETRTYTDVDRAEALLERDGFEEVDEDAVDTNDESDGEEFDADAWLDRDYQERADAVAAGDVDEHLDAVADAESSDTVLDAIGERRAELEE